MKASLVVLRAVGAALDELDIAMCAFDSRDHALHWNSRFLAYFPEHDGHVYVGEHYSDNLRRFYRNRLAESEFAQLDQYVQEGVDRHRSQSRPYDFEHRGERFRVSTVNVGFVCKVRIWRKLGSSADSQRKAAALPALPMTPTETAALESIADGALVVDREGHALWANAEFRRMYRVASVKAIVGMTFPDIYRAAWEQEEDRATFEIFWSHLRERRRFAGAPHELPLPGDRWVRVIEGRGDPLGVHDYQSHVDITGLKRKQYALSQAKEGLLELASTDGLTGLRNRAWFDSALESEWRRARRSGRALSLLLIDVDHFKRLNDRCGHLGGDEALRQIARAIAGHTRREGDVVCRYGGEEFAVLLPATDSEAALVLAESIRAGVRSLSISLPRLSELQVSVSVGVCTVDRHGLDRPSSSLVECADIALYRAKGAGRDRVEVYASHLSTQASRADGGATSR